MRRTPQERFLQRVTGLLVLAGLPYYITPRDELSLRLFKGSTKLGLDTHSTRKVMDVREKQNLLNRARQVLEAEGLRVTDTDPPGPQLWVHMPSEETPDDET